VPLIVDPPSGFDTDCLNFSITPETIIIATNNAETKLPDKLDLKVTPKELDIGFSKDVLISNLLIGTNIINMSDTDTVNISLNSDGLASRNLTVTNNNIHTTNAPNNNYDYTVLTQQLLVKLVGPADIINEVTAADLDVEVNLLGADDTMNQFPYEVTVSCSKYNNVWSVTNDRVNIKKTLKEGVTTQAAANNYTTTTKTG
jgi:hypothetical protein